MRDSTDVTGFTLMEMVMVLIVMSVVALTTTSFITWGVLSYVDGNERQRLLEQSRFAVERLTRELRGSVPYSVRVGQDASHSCIEFTPIAASSSYLQDPGATFEALADADYSFVAGDQIIVNPQSSGDIYGTNDDGRLVLASYTPANPADSSGINDVVIEVTIPSGVSYESDDDYSSQLPNRYYIAREQVSYCIEFSTDKLFRYSYPYSLPGSTAQDFPPSSSGELMAELLVNDASDVNFAFADTFIVELYFEFARLAGEEPMTMYHEVRLANVN